MQRQDILRGRAINARFNHERLTDVLCADRCDLRYRAGHCGILSENLADDR
jgi:hypothetical protein